MSANYLFAQIYYYLGDNPSSLSMDGSRFPQAVRLKFQKQIAELNITANSLRGGEYGKYLPPAHYFIDR